MIDLQEIITLIAIRDYAASRSNIGEILKVVPMIDNKIEKLLVSQDFQNYFNDAKTINTNQQNTKYLDVNELQKQIPGIHFGPSFTNSDPSKGPTNQYPYGGIPQQSIYRKS